MPAQPLPPAGQTGQQQTGILQAWKFKADMARQKNIELFMEKSGDLANTTDVHRALRSGLHSMREFGFACGPLISLLDEASRLSPDGEGKSRKEALQLLEESPLIIPGVGSTGIRQTEELGRLGHFKRAIFGNPQEG